jgi:peptidoglycan/xylan/chitin deacetylase (PgdA/CDA1 family)
MKPLENAVCHAMRWAGLMPALRRAFACRAIILMFHEIQRDCRSELMTGISVSFFGYSLNWLQQEGWKFVGLEDCFQRLSINDRSGRYAVITFDDGYRDNMSAALHILEHYNAPFTMYVPTGALTRTLQAWWLGLRELVRSRDTVLIDAMDARFHCPDYRTKVSVLIRLTEWVHEDYRRAEMLIPIFKRAGVSMPELNHRYFLDEREIQALARHPCVSIGGHTTSHAALKILDTCSARAEIVENRQYLENLLQLPVRHFAYPYGGSGACGPRDEHLVRDAGFQTAVTTRHGQLRDDYQLNYFSLPRIGVYPFDTSISFQARMNGLGEAWRSLFGRTTHGLIEAAKLK